MREHIVLIGASVRAAAESALRAGLRPWCVDLFADRDLQAICPARKLCGRYPESFLDVIVSEVRGPWAYTGGLENHPRLVSQLAKLRPLWGNDGDTLRKARNPETLAEAARTAGLPTPTQPHDKSDSWLLKPRHGAGGRGICFWHGQPISRHHYLQRYVAGDPVSVVFAGPTLLGMTRQLIGEDWLGADRFHYCGNIGPIHVEPRLEKKIIQIGEFLAESVGLRGLFGIDGILRDHEFWPIELNPRYVASIEVLERATGMRSMEHHARAFAPVAFTGKAHPPVASRIWGKAILFARADLTFPAHFDARGNDVADVPNPRDAISTGQPILTIFAQDATPASCLEALRRRAVEIEAILYAES